MNIHWKPKDLSALILALTAVLLFGGQALALEKVSGTKGDMLSGKTWQLLSIEGKRAYVLGAGEIVQIEKELIAKHPHLKKDSFSEKFAEALEGIPIDDIVSGIDTFYRENPDALADPVMGVIWDTMIKPRVSTIAGKPITQK